MKKTVYFLCAAAALLLLTMCHHDEQNAVPAETEPEEAVKAPDFAPDSAFAYVKAQTDFGPRVPNSTAHAQCARYLASQLSRFCDTVYVQAFDAQAYDGTVLKSQNIIGVFNPDATKRVVLSSHWDSRPYADHDADAANHGKAIDGANDGASGVGVLIEVARQLAQRKPNIGVDIVFFDSEDYGAPENVDAPAGEWWGLGAQYWSNNPHVAGYRADYGVLLDMVGDASAHFRYEFHSKMYAQPILAKVWNSAYKLGYGDVFCQSDANPITDDHYYVNTLAHIPMIDIIHQEDGTGTGFPLTWHTLNDNISHIDRNMLAKVGTTLLYVLYNE